MNKLVKRGLKAYNIFLKNKLAASLMMLIPGLMMTFAAIQGNGNDTKSLPLMILLAGAVFSFWGFFRLGYSKCVIDRPNNNDDRGGWRRDFFLLMLETVLYLIIAALGVFLLMNEKLTNRILNLMAGGFTTFNGIMGAIRAFKGRENAGIDRIRAWLGYFLPHQFRQYRRRRRLWRWQLSHNGHYHLCCWLY